jgi:putative membrane protein insertion efficiency factor
MKWIFILPVKIYRFFSPLFGINCRFIPSCSEYSIDCVKEYGIIKGGYKSLKRILRCNPWGGSGYDPVKGK